MKRISIIGGGFGGLAALSRLCSYRKKLDLEITLFNDKKNAVFLPLLPDCLGRGVSPGNLVYGLDSLSGRMHFNFVQDSVVALDLAKKVISTLALTMNYDFLIIASGSETNFYGNEQVKKNSFKLDDDKDAVAIRSALDRETADSIIVSGGGYTGIEVATNLRLYLDKKKMRGRVVIVERAPSILGPLPQWMKDYVVNNLKKCDIEVLTNAVIEKCEAGFVQLSDGSTFHNSLLIWASGVKTAAFIQNLKVEKNPQGRLKVDEYLRLNNACFAAGDAAFFAENNNYLRMAVQFAITQGACAATNTVRSIIGKPLVKYRPVDFGYVIPMANNRACGNILGVNMKGAFPVLLHYFMCIFRSYGLKNKIGIIKDLLKGG